MILRISVLLSYDCIVNIYTIMFSLALFVRIYRSKHEDIKFSAHEAFLE
jgi:hypothetical protein